MSQFKSHAKEGYMLKSLNTICFYVLTILLLLFPAIAMAQQKINLTVGQIHVLPSENIARVAVGDGNVLNAVTDDDKEVVLFARAAGDTSLQLWDVDGNSKNYHITVGSAVQNRLQHEIRNILNRIQNVKATVLGEKVIVEGEN